MVDISILIPVYRSPLTVDRSIRSALRQKLDLEVICVDDCPEHPTAPYTADPRVRWLAHEVNRGPGATLETAACAATGRYCVMLGDDDFLEPDSLHKLVEVMDAQPELAFVYGCTRYFGERSDVHVPPPFRLEDFYRHFPSLNAYVWRRSIKEQHGVHYRDEIERNGRWLGIQDWVLALQLLKHGTAKCLPDVVVLNYLLRRRRNAEVVAGYTAEVMASARARHPELSEDAII